MVNQECKTKDGGEDEEKEEEDEKEIANCVHMQAAAKSQTCL